MAKKILALFMALFMVLITVSNAAFFTDLQDGSYDWAKDTIIKLADEGVIKGYSDGTYGPGKAITRQEAFTLFARAAGVNDSFNAYGVEFNQYEYKDIADNYNTYAKKELCFMLERDILDEADLGTYLSDDNKNKVMLRHEAAVLISKILGIRGRFDEDAEYEYDFTDIDKIPNESLAAVAFAQSEGILAGMEDGSFSPNTPVTRAQVAIMLDRTIKKLGIQYITGSITDVYEDELAAEIDGTKYVFDDKTIFRVNGADIGCEDLKLSDSVTLVSIDSGIWAVEVIRGSELVFESVKGTVSSISASSVTLKGGKQFGVSAFLSCYEKGEKVKLEEMNLENPVTLKLVNGFVREIHGMGDVKMYEGAKIISMATIPEVKVMFEDEDGDVNEFAVSEDAKITKNGFDVEIKDLATKDAVYIAVEDGMITKIGSYTNFGDKAFKIRQIVIDEKESSVVLDFNDGERVKIEEGTKFIKESGAVVSIYDLRLGETVIAEFEEGVLSALRYGKYVPATSFGGEITKIDYEAGIIEIDADGETRIVKINEDTSIINYSVAKKITINDLDVVDYVVVSGEHVGSDFVATSIIL